MTHRVSNPPRISVLIPSYNHVEFVGDAVRSVLAQSLQDFELIITDDASRDGTADVVRSFNDPRIRLEVFSRNAGACVAMNNALGRASGEYISVLNSDDIFLEGKLQCQALFLDENPGVGAVFGRPRFIDERGDSLGGSYHAFVDCFTLENRSRVDWLKRFFYEGNCLCHPTVMIRRHCYHEIGAFDPCLMQLPDLDFWIRLCSRFDIHILPEELTGFRVLKRERNTSAPSRQKLARHAWETASVLENYCNLPENVLRSIFQGASSEGRSAKAILALEALKVGKPGYKQFGLGLLRELVKQNTNDFSHAEYFEWVGRLDPFSVELNGPVYRWLKKTRIPAAIHWFHGRLLSSSALGSPNRRRLGRT